MIPLRLSCLHGSICGEIDSTIEKHTDNYKLERVSAVDRSILRLAIYEILFCDDIPAVVSINEAIEIAKRFGTEESGRFVNGILDNLHRQLRNPSTGGEQVADKGTG